MISKNSNRLSLADCVRLLDTPGADLSFVQDSIHQWAKKPITDSTETKLAHMQSQRNITEKVLSRYLYYKAKRITREQLFPFQIIEGPGEVNKPSGHVKCYFSHKCIFQICTGSDPDSFLPENFTEKQPGYVVNIPLVLGLDSQKNRDELRRIMKLFRRQAFSETEAKSKVKILTRLALVLGLNRCKSIDKDRNTKFKKFINQYQLCSRYKVFVSGFFWKPIWQKTSSGTSTNVSMKVASKYFRTLQKIDPKLAEKIRKIHEEPEKGLYKSVPFQEIRETVKNSYHTQEAVRWLRSFHVPRQLYLAIMDPDCKRLRNDGKGLFSHYNQIVKRKLAETGHVPTIMSTGYKAPNNAPPLIILTIKLDQHARAAMAEYFPGAPYLPEPNLMIKILRTADTVEESFMDDALSGLESRHIVKHVIEARELDKSVAIVFQNLGAIPTTIPNRFYTDKNRSETELTYDKIGQKQILKTLRGVTCQSHISPLWGWAYNIARELSIPGTPQINKALTKVLAIFDPITLAKEYEPGHYTVQKNFHQMMKLYRRYHTAMSSVYQQLLKDFRKHNIKPHKVNLIESIRKAVKENSGLSSNDKAELHKRCQDQVVSLVKVHNELVALKIPLEEVSRIVQAAAAVGKSIYKDLNSYKNL